LDKFNFFPSFYHISFNPESAQLVSKMGAHVFWPPLTFLVMSIAVIMFLVLKYGDKLCKARSVPLPQTYEIEEHSSENTTYLCEDRASYRDMMIDPPELIDLQEKKSKECAV